MTRSVRGEMGLSSADVSDSIPLQRTTSIVTQNVGSERSGFDGNGAMNLEGTHTPSPCRPRDGPPLGEGQTRRCLRIILAGGEGPTRHQSEGGTTTTSPRRPADAPPLGEGQAAGCLGTTVSEAPARQWSEGGTTTTSPCRPADAPPTGEGQAAGCLGTTDIDDPNRLWCIRELFTLVAFMSLD